MINFILNEKVISTDLPAGMVLLDFIRNRQQLKGTKIGCREGDCGACSILVGDLVSRQQSLSGEARHALRYRSATSCLMPLGNANGKHIVTVEGINGEGLNPIQQAIVEEGATQCGFCTPGFIMSLAGYCLGGTQPTAANAIASIGGNICRCTGYKSIERAAVRVNDLLETHNAENEIQFLSDKKILPDYFRGIRDRLEAMNKDHSNVSSMPAKGNFVGGGTDLYVQKHDALVHSANRYLADDPLLKGIRADGNRCVMGASVTVTDMCESRIICRYFPDFEKYAKLISSTPIRNMATIAGNFVNASPIGDLSVFFLALDAELLLSDGSARRSVPLKEFYKGYKVIEKKPEEFIESISFEIPDDSVKFNFEKVSKRTHLDIASVNTAMKLLMNGDVISIASISAGGLAPVPMLLSKTSAFLKGKMVNTDTIENAIRIAQTEIAPISDARGSKEYKRLLFSQLLKAHFIELFDSVAFVVPRN